jgi:hypothetical protein
MDLNRNRLKQELLNRYLRYSDKDAVNNLLHAKNGYEIAMFLNQIRLDSTDVKITEKLESILNLYAQENAKLQRMNEDYETDKVERWLPDIEKTKLKLNLDNAHEQLSGAMKIQSDAKKALHNKVPLDWIDYINSCIEKQVQIKKQEYDNLAKKLDKKQQGRGKRSHVNKQKTRTTQTSYCHCK